MFGSSLTVHTHIGHSQPEVLVGRELTFKCQVNRLNGTEQSDTAHACTEVRELSRSERDPNTEVKLGQQTKLARAA